jgi:Arc/MetJ family transcription regulator
MRTNIVIDDGLMEEALRLSGAKTKRDAVHKALEEFIAGLKRRDLKEIRGKIEFAAGYDYKKLRRR